VRLVCFDTTEECTLSIMWVTGLVQVDYKVIEWKKICQLGYSLKDTYEIDIFSSIHSLQHAVE